MRDAAYSVAVCALQGELLEAFVRAEAVYGRHLTPVAIRTKFPCKDVICEQSFEDALQSATQFRIVDRHNRLNAAVEVARHEVRGTEVVLRLVPVAEREDT